MSNRKAPPPSGAGTGEPSDPGHYHQSEPPYYYPPQSAPTQQQTQQPMTAYPTYPPTQHYGHPYPPHYGNRNMGYDPLPNSSPQGLLAPHMPYPRTGRNLTAVTPESGNLLPADFRSPPSNMKRRTLTPGSSISPSKKARPSGAFHHFPSFLPG